MITVLKFGIGRLGGATAEALDQVFRRHQLRNKLVEIELAAQAKFDAVTAHIDRTALDEAEAALKVATEAAALARAEGRTRKDKVSLKPLRDRAKLLREQWKADKRASREDSADALEAIETERRVAIKAASTSFGLWWCNYDAVLTDHETARQRLLQDRKKGLAAEFKFHKYCGEGSLSVRYQTGMGLEDLGTDTRFQLALPDASIYSLRRGERKRAMRTRGRIRVGSTGRAPLWLELEDVHVHRPVPPGAVIRQAEVHIQKVGGRHRGSLCLVVAVPDPVAAAHRTDTVAIDLGWRRLADSRARVAMVGSLESPACHQVFACAEALRDLDQCDRLQSILDEKLNEWKAATKNPLIRSIHRAAGMARDGCGANTLLAGRVRDLLADGSETSPRARSAEASETNTRTAHAAYYERYLHLESWQANLRDQAITRRTEEYRIAVSRLLKNAKRVIVEDFNINSVIPDNDTNKFRARCAPSDFRLAVLNYCRREGVEVVKADAAMTTRRCFHCKREYKWNQATELVHECLCGEKWDQDENAVRNLLATIEREPETIPA